MGAGGHSGGDGRARRQKGTLGCDVLVIVVRVIQQGGWIQAVVFNEEGKRSQKCLLGLSLGVLQGCLFKRLAWGMLRGVERAGALPAYLEFDHFTRWGALPAYF
jgi:hypothetical protein